MPDTPAPRKAVCKHCGHEITEGETSGYYFHSEPGRGYHLGRCQFDVTEYGYNAESIGAPCEAPCLGTVKPDPNERTI